MAAGRSSDYGNPGVLCGKDADAGGPLSANQGPEVVAMATLQIELEDMAGTSWWAGVLATLASQSGNAYLHPG